MPEKKGDPGALKRNENRPGYCDLVSAKKSAGDTFEMKKG
jgi:hypothetical protein